LHQHRWREVEESPLAERNNHTHTADDERTKKALGPLAVCHDDGIDCTADERMQKALGPLTLHI